MSQSVGLRGWVCVGGNICGCRKETARESCVRAAASQVAVIVTALKGAGLYGALKTLLDGVYRQTHLKYQLLPTRNLNYPSLHNGRQFSLTAYWKFGNYHLWSSALHS